MKEYKYRINGSLYNVTVNNVGDETADVEVNGIPYSVELEKKPKKPKRVMPPEEKYTLTGIGTTTALLLIMIVQLLIKD